MESCPTKEALKLKAQLPVYAELDKKLAQRFGLALPPRALKLTEAELAGKYSWRAKDRAMDVDLKPDGTFTAYNQPDTPSLEDLVRDGKGRWKVEKGQLTVEMTHVWVGVFWKEYHVIWIERETIEKATDRKIELEVSEPLVRKD